MSRSTRRVAASHSPREKRDRSGVPGRKDQRRGGPTAAAAGDDADATPAAAPVSATTVPEPCRPISQPSATSCAYASTTTPRETPSSLASVRVLGSRVPAASCPDRTAARSSRSSAARLGPTSGGSSSSRVALSSEREVVLAIGPLYA